MGLNAMLFRTEDRKCNHWATGRLLELGSKFNGTCTYIKCTFYWQPCLALNVYPEKIKDLVLLIGFYCSQLFNLSKKKMISQLRRVLLQVFAYWIQANKEQPRWEKNTTKLINFTVSQVRSPFLKGLFKPKLVEAEQKILRKLSMDLNTNMEKTEFPCWDWWTLCPPEPKLGIVTTWLQWESVNWIANLTVLICTWNVVSIDSITLNWKLCNWCISYLTSKEA